MRRGAADIKAAGVGEATTEEGEVDVVARRFEGLTTEEVEAGVEGEKRRHKRRSTDYVENKRHMD